MMFPGEGLNFALFDFAWGIPLLKPQALGVL
jgi:hypothetical protein